MGAATAALLALPLALAAEPAPLQAEATLLLESDRASRRWLSCTANNRGDDLAPSSTSGQRRTRLRPGGDQADEIWIQRSQQGFFVGHADADASWACKPLLPGFVISAPGCQTCMWFDTQDWSNATADLSSGSEGGRPKAADTTAVQFHLDDGVLPRECLDGSFQDSSDINAWLRRDELVHRHRYAAACVPAGVLSQRMLRITATVWCVAVSLLSCSCFACARRRASSPIASAGEDDAPWAKRFSSSERFASASSGQAPPPLRGPAAAAEVASAAAADKAVSHADYVIREIHEELLDSVEAPEAERKRILRRHLIRWHPDKNSAEDQETATAVLQFLNGQKKWFLAASANPEAASLLPH